MGHERSYLCASFDGRQARAGGRGLALDRPIHAAAEPSRAGKRPGQVGAHDRQLPGLHEADGAQRHKLLQRARDGGAHSDGVAAARAAGRLRRGRAGAAAGDAAPEPAAVRQADRRLDAGTGGRGRLRDGDHRRARERRDGAGDPGADGRALAAGQALDHQPRPRVRAKKSARDRLIRRAATHPDWALGFQDEVWWSRLARPCLRCWMEADQSVRLVEQAVAKDDPRPQALACYGLYLRPPEGAPGRMLLRFVDGRPVSAITVAFLEWCAKELAAEGKKALLLIWDNASWHVSKEVRAWIRAHNREVKRTGEGVRIIACYLPVKSPWLNAIEPKWAHGKREVHEPDRLLTAQELIERVCAYYHCPHEPHLATPIPPAKKKATKKVA